MEYSMDRNIKIVIESLVDRVVDEVLKRRDLELANRALQNELATARLQVPQKPRGRRRKGR